MPGKVWTERELRMLRFSYLVEKLSFEECSEMLGDRTPKQVERKIYSLKWHEIRKLDQPIAETDPKGTLATDNPTQIAKSEGNALGQKHLDEVARRAASATTTAFDYFEQEANKKNDNGSMTGDIDTMESALKIADRASAMARKSLGLDVPGANYGKPVFNVYFSEGMEVRKVDTGTKEEEDVIDV